MSSSVKAPTWFYIVAAVALICNLLGVLAFFGEVTATPESLVEMFGEEDAQAIMDRPAWLTAVYAVAVFGGAIGCLLLLLRKKLAAAALATSLIAVIVQQASWYANGLAGKLEGMEWFMPIGILMVAIVLVMLAKQSLKKGWIR